MKEIVKKVASNTVWQLVQRIGSRIIAYFLIVYLARKLEVAAFGTFIFANSFVHLFIILMDLGITTLTIREIARDKTVGPKYIGNIVILKLFLSAITLMVIVIFMNILDVQVEARGVICLLAGYFLLENFGTFFGGVFQAYEKMEYNTVIALTQKSLLFLICFILLSKGYGLMSVCGAYLFSGIFHCTTKISLVNARFFRPKYQINLEFWKQVLKASIPMAIVAAIAMTYYNIDMVMLEKIKGAKVVSWYGVSYHLYYALATLAGAFLAAIFPVMSRFYKTSKESLSTVYDKCFKLILAFGLPISIGGFFLAEHVIVFLYTDAYQQSVIVFQMFSLVIIMGLLNSLASYFLVSVNRQHIIARVMFFTTTVNIVVNALLIPKFSYMGAVWATLISEVLFFTSTFVSIPKKYRKVSMLYVSKAIGSCIVMAIGLFLINLVIKNIFVLTVAGAFFYLIAMYVMKYLDDSEMNILKSIVYKVPIEGV